MRFVFVHTAGIHRPDREKTGTDIAVGALFEEIRGRWPTVSLAIRPGTSNFPARHARALVDGVPPVILDKVREAPDPSSILKAQDRIVLADDYAGLLLARGWKPAVLVRHNALHHTYPQGPSDGLFSRIQRRYNSWLARRFDVWSTRAAHGVIAPAGTTEVLLRDLVPDGRIRPWHPIVPRRPQGPLPVREGSEALTGLFFANFAYAPNCEALHLICREIAPRLEASGVRIRVCGPRTLESLEGIETPRNVSASGFEADLERVAAGCDFGILPIMRGEGILLKTLTMMGMGLPVVGTHRACAGTGLRDGEHARIVDDVEGMVAAIASLADPSLRRKYGAASWELAARFSCDSGIVAALEELFGPGPDGSA